MRLLTLSLVMGIACLLVFSKSAAQQNSQPIRRTVHFNFIGRDSIDLAMSDNFELIEDSCSQIIRHGHLNVQDRRFTGHFTDVSRQKPDLVLTDGTYNRDGQKDGYFTTNYINGINQAKGHFKANLFDGKWELFYDTGKPKLTFEAIGAETKIIDAWNEKGVKTVDNGAGIYRVDYDQLYWKGKLLNGQPEGIWKFVDSQNGNTTLNSETYKNGLFQKGNNALGAYTDARLKLITADILPFIHAEEMLIALTGCDPIAASNFVNAYYKNGDAELTRLISQTIYSALRDINPNTVTQTSGQITIDAEVNEHGALAQFKSRNIDFQFSNPLISALHKLPLLIPAMFNGKAVAQKISFDVNFTNGQYKFTYRFLPHDFTTK